MKRLLPLSELAIIGFLILHVVGTSSTDTVPNRVLHSVAFAKGFGGGAANKKDKKGAETISLSPKAKKLLKKHKKNVDAARSEYFQSQLQNSSSNKDDAHEARVAATWNTVAMFLPEDYARTKGKVEEKVKRRLKCIVGACRRARDSTLDVLDVGCGDGIIIPYLQKDDKYSGFDIASEMIELGKRRWGDKYNFWVGSFPQSVDRSYDTILFNGCLHNFQDTRQTLSDAANLLKPGGRIVLAHVNGAKVVREDVRQNPMVAVRNLPNGVTLESISTWLGLDLIMEKDVLLQAVSEYDASQDGDNDQFYLVALEKPFL